MRISRLVTMANDIGAFFGSDADKAEAAKNVAGHLTRFWDPRMRREIVEWVNEHDGEGLTELAAAAIKAHRERLLPPQR